MSDSADLAIVGASIRTLDPDRPSASAVAVRDGVVVAVGDDAAIREVCGRKTEVVDGAGMALTPGLVDSHFHPVWGAQLSDGIELTGLTSLDAVRDALAAERRRIGPDAWLRGWSLDYKAFGGGPVEWAALAEAAGNGPALILFYDLHTAVASPAALEAAGITGPVEFDDASEVVCRDGVPTGELLELSAYHLVLKAAPERTPEDFVQHLRGTFAKLNAAGLTGVHGMDGAVDTFHLFGGMEEEADLSLRLIVPLWQTPAVTDEEVERQLTYVGAKGRRWRGGVAKLFIDGVVDTGTAWLHEPDVKGEGLAPFWPEPQRYADVVARFAGAGFQCVTHACGDRAVTAALDAYAAADRSPRGPHRVEHLETMLDADVERIAALGVVASMQISHMQWREDDASDSWSARLGPERTARGWRTRDLLDAGTQLALGTDWPVAHYDPRQSMAWARLRRTPGAPDRDVFDPDQRLAALEALEGHTTWAAAAVGEADVAGRIKEGFRADLTGWAADPVDTDADELVDLPIRLTVVDGDVVFRGD